MIENEIIDEEYFRYLYDKYFLSIYRISFLYLNDKAEAEDIVQESFIRLIDRKNNFQDENHIKAWLITVAKNLSKDKTKSFWNRNKVNIDKVENYIETDEDIDQNLKYVLEELLLLPQKYRVVLYLFYYENYYIKEISEILSIKESTIQTQLARGRKLLEIKIKERFNE